ncbi:MAG: condensation domain-containing protein, partial [Verrucomicrobiaceae bacterium]
GAPGELFLGGDGVAAGYLNQPKLTAEKFVPDPFSGKRGARLYRTGDLVRWTSDGCIEFLGRIDHQVKVRGFRIELGEIEMALLKIPEVQEAVVVLREDVPGVRQLAAYIVAKPGMRIQNPRRILGEHLPGYMVPSFMIELAALPLTPNGKIDRRALPGPGRDHSGPEFVAPQTETEELVAGVWSDVLKVPLIGATDHFFGLGGDSLRAMDVIARLRKALGRDIPIRLLFEKSTVESFAAGIQNLQSPEEEMQGLKIVRASREQPVPLSFYQARVWQYAADCRDGTYNNPICFRLKGPLNVPALEHSLTELVRRHEILRTAISVTNGMPSQYIHPPSPVTLRRKEMTGRFYNDDAVVSIFKEETLQPFNLEIDPGFRVLLLRWSPREHMLLFVFHGMIYDGTLRETFFSQLSGLYAAYAANEVPDIPEPKLQYADFALWQRRWLRPDSKIYQRVFNYWKNQLGGELHPLQLPFSRSKPVEENLENAYRAVLVDGELARALSTFSRSHSATLFMTMLAGFKVLLSHHTGVKDLLIGTYFGDRDHPELEGVFGPFSNLLPLRTDLSGATTFRETLARVRETVLQAHANQHLPYEELLKALQTAGCPAPEVRAIVVFTNVVRPIFHLDGLRVGLSLPKLQGAIRSKPWGFTLNITQVGKRMGTVWICDTDKYDPDLVLRMSSQFMDLLKKVVVDIDTPVSDLLADEPLKLRGTTSAEPHFDQS